MGRKHKTYPKENDDKQEHTIKELKNANRRLKSDNERLKKELATLEEAFKETTKYLKGNTDGFSVKEVIQGVKDNKTLKEIKEQVACSNCGCNEFKMLNGGTGIEIRFCLGCKKHQVIKDEVWKREYE